MATLDVTSASSALKVYYTNQRMIQLTYKDCPLYAMIPKHKNFEGSTYPLPMRVTNPQGRSATFSNAQGQKQPSNYKTFQLTRKTDYSLASITTEAILASSSNPGAFIRLATAEIDGALESLKRSIAFKLYGDGSGALGSVDTYSSANPAVLQFQNPEDIVKIEVGQTLEVRSGATVRNLGAAATSALVTNVNRDTGAFTIAADNSGATATVAQGDTVNVVGDYDAAFTGLAGWVPATAPTSTPFFSVDRSVDATRLGGVRVPSTGKPLDEALIDGARRINREGGSPDYAFMSFDKYAALEKTLGSRIRYTSVEIAGTADVTFRAIEVPGPNGVIRCMADRDCPSDRIYLLTMQSWGLYSLKEPIMIVDLDGNKMLREASADAYEVRCAFYGQLGCDHPGSNAVLTF